MQTHHSYLFQFVSLAGLLFLSTQLALAQQQEIYQIKEYHFSNSDQEARLDTYLEKAYLPAMQRAGVDKIGVFKPAEQDENTSNTIFVLVPYNSLEQFMAVPSMLLDDTDYSKAGSDVLEAVHDNPAFDRIESTLLHAFKMAPRMEPPSLGSNPSEQIYELRSYEAATESLFRKKVKMFNEGGEIDIFKDLGFNAVFYGEVISGDKMPNLMYMTSFSDMASRDAHWESFRAAPAWKKLSAIEEYDNTVSHADIYLLHPTSYSGI